MTRVAGKAALGVAMAMAALPGGCGDRELPPLGEALVVVDTDLAVPRVASRLRVDTYAFDGTWLEARDVARPDRRDWPASFSVQAPDDVIDRDVVVRVRVYGTRTRDVATGPRLVRDGVDVTPSSEPAPSLAVDRLVRVRLRPGERGRVRVVAEAACAGRSARIAANDFETCIGGAMVRLDAPSPLEGDLATPTESLAGSAARSPCSGTARPGAVCIEGGTFVSGPDDVIALPDPTLPGLPERVVRITTFALDVHEVTVARYRDALARGFAPPDAVGVTEGPLGIAPETTCPYSAAPRDREGYAMACTSWATARAFCNFEGGDLPSEAQWEYAATSASRAGKVIYPWGDDVPDCRRVVFGRLTLAGAPGPCELEAGSGPRPVFVDTTPFAPGDLSAAGIQGLGGGVAEWMRDAAVGGESGGEGGAPCATSDVDPVCDAPTRAAHVVRGGSWASTILTVRSVARLASSGQRSFVGFRCAYRVVP
ncbi:MAG: SUMF1/EgtB/PvdO family nonheme iron enzyme [Deltaproteobacteria bacterium]|nr:SUMF1/EgtB/PvdO family nonheme iron enzyme [Deltaproteobacteria bacterium]